jgi:hypothetical protein
MSVGGGGRGRGRVKDRPSIAGASNVSPGDGDIRNSFGWSAVPGARHYS